jgi:hypothetical protein
MVSKKVIIPIHAKDVYISIKSGLTLNYIIH